MPRPVPDDIGEGYSPAFTDLLNGQPPLNDAPPIPPAASQFDGLY